MNKRLALLAASLVTSVSSFAAPVDTTALVTDIAAQAAPVAAVGGAVLLIVVAVKAFNWIRAGVK